MSWEQAASKQTLSGLLLRWLRHPLLWLWLGVALVLAVLGQSAASVARLERSSAAAALQSAGTELADTYEARAMRELRGIEQLLNLVAFAGESVPARQLLDQLDQRHLLPAPQIYTLRVVRAGSDAARLHGEGDLWLRPPSAAHAVFTFGRALQGASAGWQVEVDVDADLFVAGYDGGRMGQRGMQALLAQDGRGLVVRGGDLVHVDRALPGAWRASGLMAQDGLTLALDDGSTRLVWVRPLYGYPLRAALALDPAELSQPFEARVQRYSQNTALGALLLLLLAGGLSVLIKRQRRQRLQFEQERQEQAREFERLAFQDALTGLPNRRQFTDWANRAISGALRYREALVLLFIDLDGFKAVNDTLGHEAGDALLQEAARRMQACLRGSDLVARLGGDEFAVLLPLRGASERFDPVADKLIEVLAAPYALAVGTCHISASIGVACCPSDGADLDALIRVADQGMYAAKRSGKGAWCSGAAQPGA